MDCPHELRDRFTGQLKRLPGFSGTVPVLYGVLKCPPSASHKIPFLDSKRLERFSEVIKLKLTDNADVYFDFPTVGGKVCCPRTAIRQRVTGKEWQSDRKLCRLVATECAVRLRRVGNGRVCEEKLVRACVRACVH